MQWLLIMGIINLLLLVILIVLIFVSASQPVQNKDNREKVRNDLKKIKRKIIDDDEDE